MRSRAASAQASAARRAGSATGLMRTTLFGCGPGRFLDFDFARDHLELRGDALERLPHMRLAVEIRGDDLVDERAARVTARNDPAGRPEIVGGRTCAGSRMRAVSSRQL